jgi:hypothetical protein
MDHAQGHPVVDVVAEIGLEDQPHRLAKRFGRSQRACQRTCQEGDPDGDGRFSSLAPAHGT